MHSSFSTRRQLHFGAQTQRRARAEALFHTSDYPRGLLMMYGSSETIPEQFQLRQLSASALDCLHSPKANSTKPVNEKLLQGFYASLINPPPPSAGLTLAETVLNDSCFGVS